MFDPELLSYWRPILRSLDPRRSMRADEVEALYAVRKKAPSETIAIRLLSEGALDLGLIEGASFTKLILCGSRGSGKTTELTRLGERVQGAFCVIQLDLAAALPTDASTLPIVVLFGVAALKALEEWAGPDTADQKALVTARREGFRQALERFSPTGESLVQLGTWLGSIGAVVVSLPSAAAQAIGASISGGATVAGGAGALVQRAQQAGQAIDVLQDIGRGPLGRALDRARQEDARAVVSAVNQILSALAERAGRPPLLLADGLDKRTELQDVLTALSDSNVLSTVAAPVVLTGPVNLRHDARFNTLRGHFATEVLYNIPIHHPPTKGGGVNPDGIAIFRDIYERRAAYDGLPEGLLQDEDLVRMAETSSGIIRDFLTLLQGAARNALQSQRRLITTEDVDEAILDFRHKLQLTLNTSRLRQLRVVLRDAMLSGDKDADQLLFENYIACYPNGDVWYRPHEALVDYIQRKSDG